MTLHFRDRREAGQLLAKELIQYRRDPKAVVYALPRGGVVTGCAVAGALELPLEIIVVRKIGHPGNPECAVGAMTETGEVIYNGIAIEGEALRPTIAKERLEIERRKQAYRGPGSGISARGKIAIVVDDGIATGLTLRAALKTLRDQKPKRIIVAVPVAPREEIGRLAREISRVVVLEDSEPFLGAVGAYYDDFSSVTDGEVVHCLELANKPRRVLQ